MNETSALLLVRAGWRHLELQRPLAAWASWQQALRIDSEDRAATAALATLETANELPAAARAAYRFQTPSDPAVRARWDARLRQGSLDDLEAAESAFADLTDSDPSDSLAWLNRALCLAWIGRNADAIGGLDRVVKLTASSDPTRAVDTWTIAEVLRLGAGAEHLADDLRHARVVHPADLDALPDRLPEVWPGLYPVETPVDPLSGGKVLESAEVFEWLDRPPLVPGENPVRPEAVPRVLATVIRTQKSLRLSTPDPSALERLGEIEHEGLRGALIRARREATPLPLAWADAALGSFRIPAGLSNEARAGLTRALVERYFESLWIHQPRNALGNLSPAAASVASSRGDATARARLLAVVRFREQLGSRPGHAQLYQGYPFDRLRRKLGLVKAEDSAGLDPDDVSSMGAAELDALTPAALNDVRLVDAIEGAVDLRQDATTARLTREWLRRATPGRHEFDLRPSVAALVRETLREESVDEALEHLHRASELTPNPDERRALLVWSAEVLARAGRPEESLRVYLGIVSEFGSRPGAMNAARDAAETLLDNGHEDQAEAILRAAGSEPELD